MLITGVWLERRIGRKERSELAHPGAEHDHLAARRGTRRRGRSLGADVRWVTGRRAAGVGGVLVQPGGQLGHLRLELRDEGLQLRDTGLERLTAGAARNGRVHGGMESHRCLSRHPLNTYRSSALPAAAPELRSHPCEPPSSPTVLEFCPGFDWIEAWRPFGFFAIGCAKEHRTCQVGVTQDGAR